MLDGVPLGLDPLCAVAIVEHVKAVHFNMVLEKGAKV